MKCEVTSNITHDVLISKEISCKNYKDICSGEKKKVNLGFNHVKKAFEIQNNSLVPLPRVHINYIYGELPSLSFDWEILSSFFSLYNIEPNWLNCFYNWGSYNKDLGGWTGCMGKV